MYSRTSVGPRMEPRGTLALTSSVFHMKITASGTKSSHQNCGLSYLHLPIFSYTYTLQLCWEVKKCFNGCFLLQIRPMTTVPLCILQNYSSVRIGFNMNHKHHTLPIVYNILI